MTEPEKPQLCREWTVTYAPPAEAHPGVQCSRAEGHGGKHQATYSLEGKTITVVWGDDDD